MSLHYVDHCRRRTNTYAQARLNILEQLVRQHHQRVVRGRLDHAQAHIIRRDGADNIHWRDRVAEENPARCNLLCETLQLFQVSDVVVHQHQVQREPPVSQRHGSNHLVDATSALRVTMMNQPDSIA